MNTRRCLSGLAAALCAAALGVPSASAAPRENVTLNVWDTETEPGPSAEMNALIKGFEAAHPGVTIKRVARNFNDYIKTVKLAASGSNAPDLLQGNEGYSVDALLVKAKLVQNLDSAAGKYGWTSRFGAGVLAPLRWTNGASAWGTGQVWGIAQKAEVVGVFYNKQTLAKLGLKVPSDFAGFEAALAAAKKANTAGIMVGGLDRWPLGHVFMAVQSVYAPAKQIRDWTFGRAGANFDTPQTRAAASTVASWAKSGYFENGFAGVSQTDAAARFAKGEGLFFITGPWENATFAEPMGKNVGFFVLPARAGGPADATGALSLPWHVGAHSKHPDLATQFLAYITDGKAASVVLSHGDLPANPKPTGNGPAAGSSISAIAKAWQTKSSANLLTPYLDWATPTMGDTLFGGLQALMAGKLSPADFTKRVQNDWASFQKSR
jgi:raffinose/stachyose/melibiose transport system substrate-binding protein